jgi:hypothetical protein
MPDQHDESTQLPVDDPARRPFNRDWGEDESSGPDGRNDDHLHDDRKPSNGRTPDQVDADVRHKAEKLIRAGRNIDPDDGSD